MFTLLESQKERRESAIEKVFEKIMSENFQIWQKM